MEIVSIICLSILCFMGVSACVGYCIKRCNNNYNEI